MCRWQFPLKGQQHHKFPTTQIFLLSCYAKFTMLPYMYAKPYLALWLLYLHATVISYYKFSYFTCST